MKERCPECNQFLGSNKLKCWCGWQATKTKQANLCCQYQILGRHCPLPGTVCSAPYGNTWYCSGHAKALDNPTLAENILKEAEENLESILESRKDWRRKLFN